MSPKVECKPFKCRDLFLLLYFHNLEECLFMNSVMKDLVSTFNSYGLNSYGLFMTYKDGEGCLFQEAVVLFVFVPFP